jgi:hypothetical protein
MTFVRLNHIGDLLVKLVDKLGQYGYRIPSEIEYLKMVYDKTGKDWKIFLRSLADIKSQAEQKKLPPPLFAVLNHFPWIHSLHDLDSPSPEARVLQGFLRQAGRAAREEGLNVVQFESEVFSLLQKGQLKPSDIPLNVLDSHPSRHLNEIYARRIVQRLALLLKDRFAPATKP